jgi:DNA-binding CsgD family transcriptional regulator
MSENIVDRIIAEEAEKAALEPHHLLNAGRKYQHVTARDAAIKRIRCETPLSLPAIGRIFGVAHSTVAYALKNTRKAKPIDSDQVITEMWGTHTMQEIAIEIGFAVESVRCAGKRLNLGPPPQRRRTPPDKGHRPFTPRCGEILRQHGWQI